MIIHHEDDGKERLVIESETESEYYHLSRLSEDGSHTEKENKNGRSIRLVFQIIRD